MKFLALFALILVLCAFTAQAQQEAMVAGDNTPNHPHHHVVRSVRYAANEPDSPPKGEAGCCG